MNALHGKLGVGRKWFLLLILAWIITAESHPLLRTDSPALDLLDNRSSRNLSVHQGMPPKARLLDRSLNDASNTNCDGGMCSPTPQPNPTTMPSTPQATNAEASPAPSPLSNSNISNVLQGASGSFISACHNISELSLIGSPFSTTIDFEYYVYLPDVEFDEAKTEIAALRSQLHHALTERAMSCRYQQDVVDTIVTVLTSEGEDWVIGRCPDTTVDPAESCWQVSAQTTATIASTLSNAELLALFFGWIEESLFSTVDGSVILNVAFQGFNNVNLGGKKLIDSDVTMSSGSVSAVSQGNIPSDTQGTQLTGPFVLAVAATVLVLLSVFLVQRRRRRRKAFIEYAEKEDDLGFEDPPLPATTEPKHKATVVNEDDLYDDNESDFMDGIRFDEESDHDPRKCTVTNCSRCRSSNKAPVFISVKKS